jgi:vacuolar-type H+-ATPase subunit E/Vma4
MSTVTEAIETMRRACKEIDALRAQRQELLLQVEILTSYLEPMSEKLCRCSNNSDYCDFHAMLADAKTSMKGIEP